MMVLVSSERLVRPRMAYGRGYFLERMSSLAIKGWRGTLYDMHDVVGMLVHNNRTALTRSAWRVEGYAEVS